MALIHFSNLRSAFITHGILRHYHVEYDLSSIFFTISLFFSTYVKLPHSILFASILGFFFSLSINCIQHFLSSVFKFMNISLTVSNLLFNSPTEVLISAIMFFVLRSLFFFESASFKRCFLFSYGVFFFPFNGLKHTWFIVSFRCAMISVSDYAYSPLR